MRDEPETRGAMLWRTFWTKKHICVSYILSHFPVSSLDLSSTMPNFSKTSGLENISLVMIQSPVLGDQNSEGFQVNKIPILF